MNNAVISAAGVYLDSVVRYPYVSAKTAILHDTTVFEYPLLGETTYIREVTGGNTSSYEKGKGFEGGGQAGSSVRTPFKARFDRELTFGVDAIEEYNSILQGMSLSSVEIAKQSWAKIGAEIDACTISTLFGATKVTNQKLVTDAGYEISPDKILGTLNNIKTEIFNRQYEGVVITFLSGTAYANLRTALVNNNGLANQAVISIYPTGDDGLEIKLDVIKYDNLVLVPVPDTRMNTKIVLLDGKTAGQEDGGWLADPTSKRIHIVAVPIEAAKLSIRHVVANMTTPASFQTGLSVGVIETELGKINEIYQGQALLKNIGIDQRGDQFKYMNRIIHDTAVFETWKHTLFTVSEA